MSDDEVDELLKAVDTSSGEINYVGMFLSKLPLFLTMHKLTRSSSRPCQDRPRKLNTHHPLPPYTQQPLSFPFSVRNKTNLGALGTRI
jgi:hypothetical protein